MSEKVNKPWDERQMQYADFVARGKTTKAGEKRSDEDFAQAIGVNRTTLWKWTNIDGWPELLLDRSLKYLSGQIPAMNVAMVAKARGNKKYEKASEKAYQTIMQQYRLMQPANIDITTDGKPLPTPVLPIATLREGE